MTKLWIIAAIALILVAPHLLSADTLDYLSQGRNQEPYLVSATDVEQQLSPAHHDPLALLRDLINPRTDQASALPARRGGPGKRRPIIHYPREADGDGDRVEDALGSRANSLIRAKTGKTPVRIIVTLREPYSEDQLAAFRSLGGKIIHTYEDVSYGFSGTVPAENVGQLARRLADPLVVIELARRGQPTMDQANAVIRTNPDGVWTNYGYTGDSNSSIADLDTGIDTAHDDLGDKDTDNVSGDADDWRDAASGWPSDTDYKVVGWKDTTAANAANPVDSDGKGHGTHIAGIMAGAGEKDTSFKGVAPDSRLVGVRIDSTGNYWSDDMIEGLDWIIQNRSTYRIKAANLSSQWCGNNNQTYNTTLTDKANTVVTNGIVFTIAAGNDYDGGGCGGSIAYPARASKVITVGATNDSDNISGFSSNGSVGSGKPDVVAPGGGKVNGVLANGAIKSTDNNPNDGYTGTTADGEGTGTSYAAPIVAGTAALVIEARESFTGQSWQYTEAEAKRVKSIILATAMETNRVGEDPDGGGGKAPNTPPLNRGAKDRVEGYGRINADAAVEAASMVYSVGQQASDTLDKHEGMKNVWARMVSLNPGDTYTFNMTPTSEDADLYLYDTGPDANGNPVIRDSSTNAGASVSETISYTVPSGHSGPCYNFYVMVKAVALGPTLEIGSFTLTSTGTTVSCSNVGASGGMVGDVSGLGAGGDIPPGSLGASSTLHVQKTPPPELPPPGLSAASEAYTFGPSGTSFSNPATISLRFMDVYTSAFMDVYTYNELSGDWDKVTAGRTIDDLNNTISVQVDHFSDFQVFAPSLPPTGQNRLPRLAFGLLLIALGTLYLRPTKRMSPRNTRE